MHDPRIGRFFAVDPLTKQYADYTPYSFSGNKVIAYIELEGAEEYYYYDGMANKVGKVVLNLEPPCLGCINKYEFAPNLDKYGYFSSKSKAEEFGKQIQEKILAQNRLEEWKYINERADEYVRNQNPLWMTFELSPFGAVGHAAKNYSEGNYVLGTLDLAFAALDAGALAKFKLPELSLLKGVPGLSEKLLAPVEKQVAEYAYRFQKSLNRPSFRSGVVEKAWNAAKNAAGKVIDEETGLEIIWKPGESRKGVWDMGHKQGKEWVRLRKQYLDGEKTWDEVLDEYNNFENYVPELPSTNRANNSLTLKNYREMITRIKYKSSQEMINEIEEKGIDINCKDEFGYSLVMLALLDKKIELVYYLLDRNVDLSTIVKQENIAHYHCQWNWDESWDAELMSQLIKKGVDIHLSDKAGNQPLWYAAIKNKGFGRTLDLVEVLLKAGADMHHKNKVDRTPKMLGELLEDSDLLKLFIKYDSM